MPWWEDGDQQPPWMAQQAQQPAQQTAQPAQQFGAHGGMLAAYQPQAGDASNPTPMPKPAQGAVGGDAYAMGVNATFNKDYKTPDWYKASGLMLDKNPEAMAAYFAANPEHYEDWKNITSGGLSKFSTDGTSLIKTDFSTMSPEAAAHYAKNPYELLAAEGFSQDPTLAYMNYYQGPGSIGITSPRTTNVSEYLASNRWTPNGIVGSNNRLAYANTAFGAGANSYRQMAGMNAPEGTGGDMQGFVNNKQPHQMPAPQGTGGGMPTYTAPGGGSSASTSSGGSTQRAVDARNETIEGRIGSLLATDASGNYAHPLIQQAANSVMQQFAGRGLLNSSMASEAAYQAAMAKAIEIAGPDAQTYFAQGRANQDASNVFERDARGYAQDDKKLAVDMDQFNRELQYRYDALKIDKETQDDARVLAQQYAVEMENIKAVNAAYDLYLRRITDIDGNASYDAATKAKMKNEAGKDFDLYARAKKISWEMSLGDRFTAAAAEGGKAPDAGGTGILAS